LVPAGGVRDPEALAVQVLRAIADFQRVVGGGHFDVKPANILVRSTHPLSLVLGDLGLARVMDGSVRFSAQAGTIAYAPPEAGRGWGQGAKSMAWDWWSAGMVIAEAALGHHPLALPDGTLPPDHDLALSPELLGSCRVDVGAIGQARLRLLCAGLLTPDVEARWGSGRVEQWLAGGSPAVEDGLVKNGRSGPDRSASVLFANVDHDDPRTLVAAIQADWLRGQELYFQDRDRALIDETAALAKSWSIDDISPLLSQPAPQDIPRRMAQLLIALDPDLEPIYDGIDLRPGGLETVALSILDESDPAQAQRMDRRLEAVRHSQVLRLWRHTAGMDDAASIEDRWNDRFDGLVSGLRTIENNTPDEEQLRLMRSWVLLASLDVGHEQRLLATAGGLEIPERHRPQWWERLRTAGDAASAALALATFPTAQGQAAQGQERAAQAEALRQAEERERARVARKEQERREREVQKRRQAAVGSAIKGVVLIGVAWWAAFVPLAFVTQIWAGSSFSEGQGGGFGELMSWVNLFGVFAVLVAGFGYNHLYRLGRFEALDTYDQMAAATKGFGVAAVLAIIWFTSKGGPSEGDWFVGPLGAVVGLIVSFIRERERDR
jgi:hypothetical protein